MPTFVHPYTGSCMWQMINVCGLCRLHGDW